MKSIEIKLKIPDKNTFKFILVGFNRFKWEAALLLVSIFLLTIWQVSLGLIMSFSSLYLIFFFLRARIIKYLIIAGNDINSNRLPLALISIVVLLLIIWSVSFESIFFIVLFLFFLFYSWDSRIIAVLALISLASCPILLSFKKDDWAEQMAVYAYFFLVMTVVLQIIEYKRHPQNFSDESVADPDKN